jgi:hypothetical protein
MKFSIKFKGDTSYAIRTQSPQGLEALVAARAALGSDITADMLPAYPNYYHIDPVCILTEEQAHRAAGRFADCTHICEEVPKGSLSDFVSWSWEKRGGRVEAVPNLDETGLIDDWLAFPCFEPGDYEKDEEDEDEPEPEPEPEPEQEYKFYYIDVRDCFLQIEKNVSVSIKKQKGNIIIKVR